MAAYRNTKELGHCCVLRARDAYHDEAAPSEGKNAQDKCCDSKYASPERSDEGASLTRKDPGSGSPSNRDRNNKRHDALEQERLTAGIVPDVTEQDQQDAKNGPGQARYEEAGRPVIRISTLVGRQRNGDNAQREPD